MEVVLLILVSLSSTLALQFPFPPEDDYPPLYHDHLGVGPTHNGVGDYYSKPKYAFGYEVDGFDEYFRELSHGRWEIRDGDVTQGQYRVLLPDGRIQIVSYIADKFGYRPTIKYVNKGVVPPPPPVYAHIKVPKLVPIPIQEPIVEYPIDPGYIGIGATYGPGFGYGPEPFALGTTNTVSSKKRSHRTLFRGDFERKKRRTLKGGKGGGRSTEDTKAVAVGVSVTPKTLTLVSSPSGSKKGRRINRVLQEQEYTDQELY